MADPYSQGYQEGLRGADADSRYCPWETTPNINRWMDGFYAGLAEAERRG